MYFQLAFVFFYLPHGTLLFFTLKVWTRGKLVTMETTSWRAHATTWSQWLRGGPPLHVQKYLIAFVLLSMDGFSYSLRNVTHRFVPSPRFVYQRCFVACRTQDQLLHLKLFKNVPCNEVPGQRVLVLVIALLHD